MSLMKALEIEQIPIYLDDAHQGGDVHRTVRLTGRTMYPSSRLAMMLMMCAIPSVSGKRDLRHLVPGAVVPLARVQAHPQHRLRASLAGCG